MNQPTARRVSAPRDVLWLLLAAIFLSAVAVAGSTPSASAQDGYIVRVADGSIEEANGQTTVLLQLEPGSDLVGAISIDIVSDPAVFRLVTATSLVNGGFCNVGEASTQFAGLNTTGWGEPVDLCEIIVEHVGGTTPSPITPIIITAVAPLDGAPTIPGNAVAGLIDVGSTTAPPAVVLPTPTPEPTVEPTTEPADDPVAQPTAESAADAEPPAEATEATPDTSDDDNDAAGTEPAQGAEDTDQLDTDQDEAEQLDTDQDEAEQLDTDQDAAEQAGTATDPDRGTRGTSDLDEPTDDSPNTAASDTLDGEAAAPEPPLTTAQDASTDEASVGSLDQAAAVSSRSTGGASTATIAAAAIGLFVIGGALGVAARRSNDQ